MRTYDRSNTRQHLSSTNGLLDTLSIQFYVAVYMNIYKFVCMFSHFADDDSYNDICNMYSAQCGS